MVKILFFHLCVVICLFVVNGDKTIGAVFDDGEFLQEAAFNVAVNTASEGHENPFVAKVSRTSPGDLIEAEDAVCSLFENAIFGVFGPRSKHLIEHVQNIVDYLEVPHIVVAPVESQTRNWSIVNLYPYHVAYSQVFKDIIEIKDWAEFTIIYEGTELLPFLVNILTMQDLESRDRVVINVVQLPEGDEFRPQLKTIKASGSLNYLVFCTNAKMPEFLQQAQQVGIMSDVHSYIIMNPDFQIFDTESFKHGGSNITGVRFFDLSTEEIQSFIKVVNGKVSDISDGKIKNAINDNGLPLEIALLYDSVILFAAAVDAMGIEEGANVTCDADDSWNYGSTVVNMMKSLEIDGLTGLVKFDEDGFRSDFELDIMELQSHGFEKVATWTTEDGYENRRIIIPPVELEGSDSMKGKHFNILTALSAPYGMLKESSNKLEGNDRYEGFGIELIEELAKMNEFNYTFDIQEDGVYGSYDAKTGEWTGMMQKIMDGRADFAITDLTITSARQKAVDFTSPFMNLGITILYKKPTKQPPDLFSFISPFSLEVWQYLAGAYVGVSVLLFVLGRMAPDEWQNPYPCIEEPETLDNQFSMANSFWFTLGSVLTQGSEIAPIAVSTRMAGSMWWFFTLIMVSSYTANLAAFLTVESKFYAIKSVSDLANNPYSITYGAKKGGATLSFFKESDNLLYQKMFNYMEEHPELMPATNDAGLERVKSDDENYAFLMESTSIEYMVERNCDVAQVGGLLDSKGYGIAMKKNSSYRQPMSESILQLQEEGKLTRMKDKWWKEKRGGGACADDDAGSGDAQPLVLANVGGVFIVLVAGSALAIVCAFLEMMVDVWTISRKYQVTFKDELIAELKFIFTTTGDVKPVRHREPSGSGSGGSKNDEKEILGDPETQDVDPESPDNEDLLDVGYDPAPTPRSERSTHSHHTLHSRRQSNAVQMARMRKFSNRSGRL
ncbi:glutamate receptor ionotropic, kainate 2-like [Amyelois transitella]|uniref:glutamate receptor ionotropic, kainate 2-like n=1 Tax=Amyelois transitella TaxID=680683 RepID=UPI00298FC2A5|nr:glutamate receptor ionotropic, kainate 2-like [Amyelois transitella]